RADEGPTPPAGAGLLDPATYTPGQPCRRCDRRAQRLRRRRLKGAFVALAWRNPGDTMLGAPLTLARLQNARIKSWIRWRASQAMSAESHAGGALSMSGHSKWHQIRRQKGVNDAKRGQLFTRLGRELVVAVREGGGGDPDANFRLRIAIQHARAA